MADMFDLVVIGGGPGGYVAAIRAAQQGMKTALVEKNRIGGTCLNRGCIPTKALLHTTQVYREILSAGSLGINVDGVQIDFEGMHQRKNDMVAKLRGGVEKLLQANKVEIITGSAEVQPDSHVKISTSDGDKYISGEKILIATGSQPAGIPIKGIDLPGVLYSDELLEGESRQYESLVIIGGGVIGVEFASIFANMGCSVTILEAQDRLLPAMEREISQNLGMILKKRGLTIYTGASIEEVMQAPNGLTCRFTQSGRAQAITAQGVLVAVGRKPCTQGLFAQAAGPKIEKGIVVNENYTTSVPNIWAIGDVIDGGTQLAHVASAQALNAVAAMLGKEPPVNLAVVPSCVYTDPEIATVGLTLDEAKSAGISVKTGKFLMATLGKSMIEEADRGFIKVVCRDDDEKIIGAQMMCKRATDLVSEFSCAIANGLTVRDMADVIRPHPTFTEGVTEALEDVHGQAIHTMPRQRL